MDLWQDVTLVPETWGISLSANILNPDEDFISTSLWNGIMNFEMDFKKEKKRKLYYSTYTERWNFPMEIYKIIKITDQNKYTLSANS